MKAMILAAGKGTRLKPLTDHLPKALVKVNGTPLLEILVDKLKKTGVNEIIINVHYLADQIIDFIKSKNSFGIKIEISHEKEELLDTGGGLKKAAWFFNNNAPFILHNVDVISNIDFNKMLDSHIKSNAFITLAVRNRKSSRYFLFNDKNALCGWRNTKTNEQIIIQNFEHISELAFSGIHIISPNIFKHISEEGKFSIVKSYLNLSTKYLIQAYNHNNDFWFDIGKPENLKNAQSFLNQNTTL